jgi:predicted Zn-dependent peptidase
VDLSFDDSARDLTLGEGVRRSILPGGVRLLTEADRAVRSASIGLWLPVGSRDETPQHAGSTHVLEHLLFKGTARRDAMAIATAFDEVGGESNAATAKEHTVYHGRVRSVDLDVAIDVLTDMVTSATLDSGMLESEREVILEELAMAQDDPTDCGYEAFLAQVLGPDTALGRPVGGSEQTVRALDAADVRAHFAEHYVPSKLVVTASGDLDHDQLAETLAERLETGGWSLPAGAVPAPRRTAADGPTSPALSGAISRHHLVRELEQTHVYLGGPSISATSPDRHAMSVLMAVLGGGMSSRLFQEIRERRGLAYTVYSFSAAYREAGLFGMYAACRPSRTEQVVELMIDQMQQLADHGPTDEEMARALGQITGALALGLEDTFSRMGRLGTLELVHGRYTSVDDVLAAIAAVTAEDVRTLAGRLAASFTTRVDVGPAA